MSRKTILLVGTYDTKQDELTFLASTIQQAGGRVLAMDVSVLGDASVLEDASVFWESDQPVAISKHDVAAAAGMDIAAVIASPDENLAMQAMARGAAKLTTLTRKPIRIRIPARIRNATRIKRFVAPPACSCR